MYEVSCVCTRLLGEAYRAAQIDPLYYMTFPPHGWRPHRNPLRRAGRPRLTWKQQAFEAVTETCREALEHQPDTTYDASEEEDAEWVALAATTFHF